MLKHCCEVVRNYHKFPVFLNLVIKSVPERRISILLSYQMYHSMFMAILCSAICICESMQFFHVLFPSFLIVEDCD
jgi:hypothetical protein